jgi:nucleoside phosphorylase
VTGVDIAAFAALRWEARAVLAALRDVRPLPGGRRWLGRLGDGCSCLVVQTGVGPQRAAAAAAAAPRAAAFLSTGCAGGLVPWLRTGDVVLATEVIRLDASCRPAARLAVPRPRVDVGCDAGPIASSATVLVSTVAKTAAAGCGAVAVDMESWAVAAEAARRGTRFAAMRVVFDAVGDTVPDFPGALDAETGEVDAWRAARGLLARPWMVPAALRMARQQGEAAERLGEALGVLLRDVATLAGPGRAPS